MMWKRLDQVEGPPFFLEEDDFEWCYFARDFISHGGYEASEANSLISNFKKDVKYKEKGAWYYRDKAVRQFAQELDEWITDARLAVSAIPSSKLPSDPDYDSRFGDMFKQWSIRRNQAGSELRVETPIRRKERTESYSRSNSRTRNFQETYGTLEWVGFNGECSGLVLIDDVITCGTHFKACQRLIRENSPRTNAFGVFWARTIWPDQDGESNE